MTILLSVLPALLFVAIGLIGLRLARRPVLRARGAQAAAAEIAQQAATAPQDPERSLQLLLTSKSGRVEHIEHEIGWHRGDPPATYRYAGKVYYRKHRRTVAHASDHVWVYER